MKIGVSSQPETTTGATPSSSRLVRLDIRRIGRSRTARTCRQCDPREGREEQVAPRSRSSSSNHVREGISKTGELIDLGDKADRREVGSWYSYDGQRIGQGERTPRPTSRTSDVAESIEKKVRENAGILRPCSTARRRGRRRTEEE